MAKRPERRKATLRRQFNESFCDVKGNVAITKVIAVSGQIMLLFYTGRYFEAMLSKPDTLLICLSLIIVPDLAKKLLNMKYGNGHSQTGEKE